jgi:DNA-binding PadR family transcriptional regulator
MTRLSMTAIAVLNAIAQGYEYGFDIIDATRLPSGTVYPALSRLERDGYVRSAWEDEATAHREGRPARRYYTLTAPGVRAREAGVARLRAALAPLGTRHPRPGH